MDELSQSQAAFLKLMEVMDPNNCMGKMERDKMSYDYQMGWNDCDESQPECMTNREQMAVAAMRGLLSNSEAMANIKLHDVEGVPTGHLTDKIAFMSVLYADALIRQLNKDRNAN